MSAGDISPSGGLPEEPFALRVYYETVSDIDRLAAYDLWEYNNLREKYVLLSSDSATFDELARSGWRLEIDSQATAWLQPSRSRELFANGYRTVDALYADLSAANTAFASLTELVDYGDSYCKSVGGCVTPGGDNQPGFDLLAIRVTNESVGRASTISGSLIISGSKPIFFLMANLHAREITTPELAMRFLDWLINRYGSDAYATWLVDWHEIWIVPTANPDGYWLVELGQRSPYIGSPFFQRKNANGTHGCSTWVPTPYSQYGVDLNRNHSFAWGGVGTSTAPCDQTFRGPAAASEPEISQLQYLIKALVPDQRGPLPTDVSPDSAVGIFISIHSFSELVLWPWGYTNAAAPNRSGLKAIGDKLALLNGYTSCQPGQCLYGASGTSDDWAYGELGIASFTFEVGTQFMPPYGEIDALQWPQNAPAIKYAASIARAPFTLSRGPDVTGVSAAYGAHTVNVVATVDDRDNGSEAIAAASYTVDIPYWAGGVISQTMAAADGTYDGVTETVTAALNATSLVQGRHVIYLRGQDSGGNWGPVSASYIYVGLGYQHFFPLISRE